MQMHHLIMLTILLLMLSVLFFDAKSKDKDSTYTSIFEDFLAATWSGFKFVFLCAACLFSAAFGLVFLAALVTGDANGLEFATVALFLSLIYLYWAWCLWEKRFVIIQDSLDKKYRKELASMETR